MNKSIPLPFGLQFAEQPINNDTIVPASVYDEDEDISVVVDKDGQRTPSVEYYRKMGTKTFTHVQEEATDDDEEFPSLVATKTATATEEESDSDDEHYFLILGTKTETFVQSEQSDEDPGIDTGTATKVAEEITDND